MPRKQAFSGKQKKLQLKAKNERKREVDEHSEDFDRRDRNREKSHVATATATTSSEGEFVHTKGNDQYNKLTERRGGPTPDERSYALMFRAEPEEEIAKRKQEARKAIVPVQKEYLECDVDDFFVPELRFPTRPPWNYSLSTAQVEANERRYFNEYLQNIHQQFKQSELSYFELNLETWRQFWRVLEMSDILLCIVDIRYPPLLFPPVLYEYTEKHLGKTLILVLNKIDLCPPHLVAAWEHYFKTKYPNLTVLSFTAFPSYNVYGNSDGLKGPKRYGRQRMAAECTLELYKTCDKIVNGQLDITAWKQKIEHELNLRDEDFKPQPDELHIAKQEGNFHEFKKFDGGILTIGCIGQPNVGKSSLINSIKGRKVVSVSRTPGHTKHFQTIFLTPNVRICDCPGLIFPSKVPKSLQVLCGSYPIAQLREPYSTIQYLGERLDLPKILKISHPEGESEWNAYDIADGWAQNRGFFTAKAARLDTYRGANNVLRLALAGRVCLCLYPPLFLSKEDEWKNNQRVKEIEQLQAKGESKSRTFDVTHDLLDLSDDDGALEKEKKNPKHSASENSDEDDEDNSSFGGACTIKNKFALLNTED